MTTPTRDDFFHVMRVVDGSTSTNLGINFSTQTDGAHVYVTHFVYSNVVSLIDPMADWEVPEGWTLVAQDEIREGGVKVGGIAVYAHDVTPDTGFYEFPSPINTTSGVENLWSLVVLNASGDAADAPVTISGPSTANVGLTPLAPVTISDSYAHLSLVRVGQNLDPTDGIGEPWTHYSDLRGISPSMRLELWDTQASPVFSSIDSESVAIAAPTTIGFNFLPWWFMVTIVSRPAFLPEVLTVAKDFARLELGCADDYRAYITGPDYETTISEIGWSQIDWGRVEDEASQATVVVPDELGGVYCVAKMGGLLPWRYGIRIERNDQSVWKGVVTNIQRQPGSIRVGASDIMVRFQMRLASRSEATDIAFIEADAGTAFAAVILAAQIDGEAWGLQPPEVRTLQTFTRDVLFADFEKAWSVLEDLADSAIDFWVGNGVLYAYQVGLGWVYFEGANQLLEGPYSASRQLVYGTFTEDSFTSLPLWSINGMSQGNVVWVPAPDGGEAGARDFWTASNPASIVHDGALDYVETGDLFRPTDDAFVSDDVFQRHADSLVALRAFAPAIIEDTPLSERAPIDIDNLRPGSLWQLDIHDAGYGQLLQVARLKKVSVTVTKDQGGTVVETIRPTLYPPGYEES